MTSRPFDPKDIERRQGLYVIRRFFFFWPIVDNIDDVERVTLLGFWVYTVQALINVGVLALDLFSQPTRFNLVVIPCVALCAVAFYYLGANAVRRKSVSAAIAQVLFALIFMVDDRMHGSFHSETVVPFLLSVIILRGIWLASRYVVHPEDGEPLEPSAALGRAFVNKWPAFLWPRFRLIFWICGFLFLAIELFAAVT